MNTNTRNPIIFFFPYYKVSGVPVLFIRFAKALSDMGRNIFIVDFEDGYMHQKLKENKNINFIMYKKKSIVSLPKNSTIIFQSILPETLPKNLLLDPSHKIIFWTLYQANFIQTIIPIDRFKNFQYNNKSWFKFFSKTFFKSHTNRLVDMINKMHSKGALFFMSQDTFDFTYNLLELNFSNPQLMPVCIDDIPKNLIVNTREIENRINILWIGRLDDFKIHILNYFICSINKSKYLKSHQIYFTIIGDGEHSFKEPTNQNNNLIIEHFKSINHNELQGFIKNSDLFAGMGTSALEAARYGIPTICLDFYYKKITFSYPFKWVYQKKKYDLGSLIQPKVFEKNINNELDDRLFEIIQDSKGVSEKTISYFDKNHSLSNFISIFEKKVNSSSFYYTDFDKKVFQRSVTRKLYTKLKSLFVENTW